MSRFAILGDVCGLDRRPSPIAELVKAGLSFVGMEHVDPETGRITIANGSRTGEGKGLSFQFDERHVLFGKLRPYLRKIALPETEGCSSTELVPLLPVSELLDRRFLFHWLRRPQVADALMAKNTGARMPRADMSVLLGMSIPLPPLDEQRRIVELLDRAAEIRRRADAARAKARALIPALFLDTFGDPATNPKGWPINRFGDAIKAIDFGISAALSGGTEWSPEKTPVIRMANISPIGDLETTNLRFLKITPKKLQSLKLESGDLLFNWRNSPKWIGKTTIWDGRMEAIFASFLYRIRLVEGRLTAEYVKVIFNLLRSRSFFEARVRQAVSQANFGRDELANVDVAFPPYELQLTFAEKVRQIEALARALDAAAAKAEKMAAALAAELFDARPAGERGTATAPSLAAD